MDNNKEDIIYGLVSWESYLGEDIPPYSELALVKQFSADFSEQYHNFVGEEKEQALALSCVLLNVNFWSQTKLFGEINGITMEKIPRTYRA